MDIKFRVEAAALHRALDIAMLVGPSQSTQEKALLFALDGEDACNVFSKGGGHEGRSSMPVSDVEGEGSFMLPLDYVSALKLVKMPLLFHYYTEDEAHKLSVSYGSCGSLKFVTLDPRAGMISEVGRHVQTAMENEPAEFHSSLLKDAISVCKSFMAPDNDKTSQEHYKTIQLFGDNAIHDMADGCMYSANGMKAAYYMSGAFKGKPLAVPGAHLPLLEKFLAKSHGLIRLYTSTRGYYVVNERGDAVGWPKHADEHKKFSYMAMVDQLVVHVDAAAMREQLNFIATCLAARDKTKIRMHYADGNFWFTAADDSSSLGSLPVSCDSVDQCKFEGDVEARVNVHSLKDLFTGPKGSSVEFRFMRARATNESPKGSPLFRTIDRFFFTDDGTVIGAGSDEPPENATPCVVTRFAAGID